MENTKKIYKIGITGIATINHNREYEIIADSEEKAQTEAKLKFYEDIGEYDSIELSFCGAIEVKELEPKWTYKTSFQGKSLHECNVCRNISTKNYPFCPICGCRMINGHI